MRQVQQIMGMPITIDIPSAKNEDDFKPAFDLMRQIDDQFSLYKPDSEVSRFARGEVKNPSRKLAQVIKECKKYEIETDGYFSAWAAAPPISHLDAVQGSKEERAKRIQKYGERATDVADAAMRQKPAGATSIASGQGEAVRNRWFDPSGYVKGWAIAQAGQAIEKQGLKTYCISAGGDILARSNTDKVWKIGIQDPTTPGKILDVLSISNGAVATSGNYERGPHIINPKTKKPADKLLSVTVTGPNIIKADVLATAIFAKGKKDNAPENIKYRSFIV